MKKIILICLIGLGTTIASCQNTNSKSGKVTLTIAPDDFDKKLATSPDAQLIDVRTPAEYNGGHLKNATNININDDSFDEKIAKLDKSKPVLVYCMSGGRSSRAAEKLHTTGFNEVYNLDGGILKWTAARKPIETGTPLPTDVGMTDDSLQHLITRNKYVLVDYNAPWCVPCQQMMPILEQLATEKKDKLKLIKVNADDSKALMAAKSISAIPYLELYADGKLVWTHSGLIEKSDLIKETNL